MKLPRTMTVALLSAAILSTTGVALADNDKHGGHSKGPDKTMSQPANQGEGQSHNALSPSGDQGPARSAPGRSDTDTPMNSPAHAMDRDRADRQGAAFDRKITDGMRANSDDVVQNKATIKLQNGSTLQLDVDDRLLSSIKARGDHKDLIFYTSNGTAVTSVSAVGERAHGRVAAINGTAILFKTDDGQTRILALDRKAAARMHLHVGSAISVQALDEKRARVVSDELLAKHEFDKFSAKRVADVDGAKAKKSKKKTDNDVADVDSSGGRHTKGKCGESSSGGRGRAFANQMAKDAANDASGHNPPGLPHECINPAGHTRGFCKSGASEVDCSGGGSGDTENDVAQNAPEKGKCGDSASSHGRGRAYANQMAKDARNDASGHNPPGLPHECLNPAGHTRGWCKSGSSDVDCSSSSDTENDVAQNGPSKAKCDETSASSHGRGRAYANQMAKDARNDSSGHNPPGLPHECINPAGHTRGWCKQHTSQEETDCASGAAVAAAAVNTPGANASGAPTAASVPVAGSAPVNGNIGGHAVLAPNVVPGGPRGVFVPVGPGGSSVGAPAGTTVGAVPAGAATVASVPGHKHPTRVMGAAVGPESIQLVPLSKTPCVWHRTAVMGAAVGPYQRIGRSYTPGSHVHRHSNCR